jgi:putative hydrolase of the HAD superfamily
VSESTQHLIVDFGGVISRPQPADILQRLAWLAGTPLSDFSERYWQHRDAYDRGLSAADYWAHVAGRELSVQEVEQLSRVDIESWIRPNPGTVAVLAAARAAGAHLTLLSNAPHPQADALTADPTMQSLFDQLIFSARVGVAKPDARIYTLALGQLPATANLLFIDDRPENVIGARRAGIPGVIFRSAEQLDDEIARHRHVCDPAFNPLNR